MVANINGSTKNRRHQTLRTMPSPLFKRDPLWWTGQQTLSEHTHTKVPLLTALGTVLIHTYIPTCHLKLRHDRQTSTANFVVQTPSPLNQIRHAKLNTPYYTTDVLQTHSPVPSSCHNEGYRQQQRPSIRPTTLNYSPTTGNTKQTAP